MSDTWWYPKGVKQSKFRGPCYYTFPLSNGTSIYVPVGVLPRSGAPVKRLPLVLIGTPEQRAYFNRMSMCKDSPVARAFYVWALDYCGRAIVYDDWPSAAAYIHRQTEGVLVASPVPVPEEHEHLFDYVPPTMFSKAILVIEDYANPQLE